MYMKAEAIKASMPKDAKYFDTTPEWDAQGDLMINYGFNLT